MEGNNSLPRVVHAVPAIIQFGYKKHVVLKDKRRQMAVCKFCNVTVKEISGTTSNFIRHLKQKHQSEYHQYKGFKPTPLEKKKKLKRRTLVKLPSPVKPVTYSPETQVVIESIANDLIIQEGLSIGFVEAVGFQRFLQVTATTRKPVSMQSVAEKIVDKSHALRSTITQKLSLCCSINATVAVSSDKQLGESVNVTVHYMEEANGLFLKAYSLPSAPIVGKQTDDKIKFALNSLMDEFHMNSILDCVLVDSVVNRRNANATTFPDDALLSLPVSIEGDGQLAVGVEVLFDDDSVWKSSEDNENHNLSENTQGFPGKHQLACFSHSLQCVVNDGIKQSEGLQPSLSKIASLSKLFQSSCSFKHAFQRVFGSKKTSAAEIPSTAWNHRLQQMQYMLSLDQQKLNKICKTTRNKAYMLSPSDWNRLKELVDILAPFAEAASAVQQSSEPAISFVLPTVLELHNRLLSFIEKKQHLRRLGADMLLSLKNHFKGIFATVGLSGESDRLADDWGLRCSHPYGNPVYVVASVLDPRFCFNWIAHVHEDEATKDNIKQRIEELVVEEAVADSEPAPVAAIKEETSPIVRGSTHLFPTANNKKRKSTKTSNAHSQLVRYLHMARDAGGGSECLRFWYSNKAELDLLYQLAKRVLCVPAVNALVESALEEARDDVTAQAYHSEHDDKLMTDLVFLRANKSHLSKQRKKKQKAKGSTKRPK